MLKTLLLLTAVISVSSQLFAQQTIAIEQVSKHIGENITVCSKIYGGKYLKTSKNQPTFLNMGGAYPKQLLTVVIWADARKTFGFAPEVKYKDKPVCVTGKVDTYKGQPQIVIYSVSQIVEK